jgi:hypothetical protein
LLLGCAHPRPDASSEADPGAAFVYSFGRGVGYSYANQLQFGSRVTGASGGGASVSGSGLSGSSQEAGRDIAKGLVRPIQTTGARRPLDSTSGIQLPPLTLGRTSVTAPHPLAAPALNQTVAAENLLPLNTAITDEQKNSGQTTGKESRISSAMTNLLPIAEYGAFGDDFQLAGENGVGGRPGRSKATEQLSRLAAGDSSSSSRQLPAVKQVQSFDVVAAVPGLPVQPLLQ